MASPKEMFANAREKAPWFDHLVRAGGRYQADTGDRLAAAVTFFGFLSFFPLLVLSASLLAIFLGDEAVDTVINTVNDYAPGLAEQLGLRDILDPPGEEDGASRTASLAGLAGLAGLLYSGLGWVDALRESVRVVWHQNVLAGNIVVKKLKDIVILAGLGVTLIFSLLVSAAAGAFTDFALELVGLDGSTIAGVLVTVLGTVLALVTSTLLFLYLFIRLPKVQTPWRRVLKGAVLAAVLFEVLKRVGAIYIERTTENPVYGIFAVAVGLLVWINLVSRMLLLVAAWTVTAPYDSDVEPSGTASPEQARKAGIPMEFADDDPDDPPNMQEDGAPSPLVAAVQGKVPPQDVPEGKPSRQEPSHEAARRADGSVQSWSRNRSKKAADAVAQPTAPAPEQPTAPAPEQPTAPAPEQPTAPAPEQPTAPAPVAEPAPRPAAAAVAVPAATAAVPAATAAAPAAVAVSDGPTAEALPGEAMTRKVAQVGAGAISVGLLAVAVYGLKTAGTLVRSVIRR